MKHISLWGKYFLLAGCEAVIAIIVLLLIPADQKNGSVLGYSNARLALMGLMFAIVLVCGGMVFKPIKWLEQKKVQSWLMIALQMGGILGMGVTILPLLGEPPSFAAIHNRLLPFIVWGTVASMQMVIWVGAKKLDLPLRMVPAALFKNWLEAFRQEVSLPEGSGTWLRLTAGVSLLAVLIPSVNYGLVNGLPIDNGFEALIIALAAPIAFSKSVSSWLAGWLQMLKKKLRMAKWFFESLLALAVLAVILHAVLYFSASDTGFYACYTTPLRASPRGDCEVFYQNPFQRYDISRIDKEMDFFGANWNLSFLNDRDFNFYSWVPGNILRERMPFSVTWTGTIDLEDTSQIVLDYSGEGSLVVGEQAIELPPSYHTMGRVELDAPAGQSSIRIHYHYDDEYRTGSDRPYTLLPAFSAKFIIDDILSPLTTQPADLFWRFLSSLADFFVLLIASVFLCFYGWLFKQDWQILLLICVALIAIWRSGQPNWMIWLNAVIFLLFLLHRKPGRSLAVAWLFFITSLVWTWFYLPSLNATFLRIAGTDMLTYEGFARLILYSGSLQGGEDIFYYQPFYRYLVFIYHLVFGDGDSLRSAFMFSLILFGIWKLTEELTPSNWSQWKARYKMVFIFICISVLLLINDRIMWWVIQGISETATWILLPWGLWLIVVKDRQRHAAWIGLLLGFSLITRTNHLPAIVFLLLFYGLVTRAVKPVAIATAITACVFTLPGLHNLYFGGQFLLLPTSSNISNNLILPPMETLTSLGQISTWQKIASQSSQLLGMIDRESWHLAAPMFILVFCWFFCAVSFLRKRNKLRWVHVVVLCLPWVFLGVQFFYDIVSMFPRHLLTGYLVMGVSLMICLSSLVPSPSAAEQNFSQSNGSAKGITSATVDRPELV